MAAQSVLNRKDAPTFHIHPLQKFYCGFLQHISISHRTTNAPNAHSRQVYVAPLIEGTPADLAVGDQIAFIEIDGDREVAAPGLRRFIHYRHSGKDVFIFDNHQHAFFFWVAVYLSGIISPGCRLVHIDRHSDMWQPAQPPDFSLQKSLSLQTVFEYTIRVLNNATFIKPALQLGLFDDVEILNGVYPPGLQAPSGYVLDIDMDIFEDDKPGSTAYRFKMRRFRKYMSQASLITIATSPGFIEQSRAIEAVKELFLTTATRRFRERKKAG